MSLSDCEKCWSTPCECGYRHVGYHPAMFIKYIKNIIFGYVEYRKEKSATEVIETVEREEFIELLNTYLKAKDKDENKN